MHSITNSAKDPSMVNSSVTHRAAVLGKPIEHSRSPVLHNAGYEALGMSDWEYGKIECGEDDLARIVGESDSSYAGFSVTMPAKFAALDFAAEVSERAKLIGSANTLVRTDTGWFADNTDSEGVIGALAELFPQGFPEHANAVVIGGGGTARPALWALSELGAEAIHVFNRSNKFDELKDLAMRNGAEFFFHSYQDEEEISRVCAGADVVVSTVPSSVIAGQEQLFAQAPVFDVIYEPWPTPLTEAAKANGHASIGGHVMLACQAYSQFEQFTGKEAPRDQMRKALEDSL